MASVEAHLRQFHHNRELISKLPSSHHDWMVTAVFYSCVHLIDAVLASENFHPVVHKRRNVAVANSNRLEFIAKKYDPLYQLCRKVRYLAEPGLWVPLAEFDRQIVRGYLYPIEQSAFRLLRRGESPPPIVLPN